MMQHKNTKQLNFKTVAKRFSFFYYLQPSQSIIQSNLTQIYFKPTYKSSALLSQLFSLELKTNTSETCLRLKQMTSCREIADKNSFPGGFSFFFRFAIIIRFHDSFVRSRKKSVTGLGIMKKHARFSSRFLLRPRKIVFFFTPQEEENQ